MTAQTATRFAASRLHTLRKKHLHPTTCRRIRSLFCAEDCGIDLVRRIVRPGCWRARPAIADFPSHTRNAACILDQRGVRFGATPKPARETHALPNYGHFETCGRSHSCFVIPPILVPTLT